MVKKKWNGVALNSDKMIAKIAMYNKFLQIFFQCHPQDIVQLTFLCQLFSSQPLVFFSSIIFLANKKVKRERERWNKEEDQWKIREGYSLLFVVFHPKGFG